MARRITCGHCSRARQAFWTRRSGARGPRGRKRTRPGRLAVLWSRPGTRMQVRTLCQQHVPSATAPRRRSDARNEFGRCPADLLAAMAYRALWIEDCPRKGHPGDRPRWRRCDQQHNRPVHREPNEQRGAWIGRAQSWVRVAPSDGRFGLAPALLAERRLIPA